MKFYLKGLELDTECGYGASEQFKDTEGLFHWNAHWLCSGRNTPHKKLTNGKPEEKRAGGEMGNKRASVVLTFSDIS